MLHDYNDYGLLIDPVCMCVSMYVSMCVSVLVKCVIGVSSIVKSCPGCNLDTNHLGYKSRRTTQTICHNRSNGINISHIFLKYEAVVICLKILRHCTKLDCFHNLIL